MEHKPSEHYTVDLFTVISISSLAYLLATFLHEMGGHGLSCLLQGAKLLELGAFYASCDYSGLSDLSIRVVAVAGPVISLLTGVICYLILPRLPERAFHWKYGLWLLGTLGLLIAAGYLLFSGVSGIGDFGFSRDGLLYQAAPEALWRVILAILGAGAYLLVVALAIRKMDRHVIGGQGVERVRQAQRLALTSYLTGGIVSVLIGFLNPLGIIIVLISAAAASLGGTSALLWMMQWLNRKAVSPAPYLQLARSWSWIIAGIGFTLLYALVLGPSII